MEDLIDRLLGGGPEAPTVRLRHQRLPARHHAEGAWRSLVVPDVPGGLSLAERAAIALRVALIEGDAGLAATYRQLIDGDPRLRAAAERFPAGDGADRLTLLLRFADLVAQNPARCDQAMIDRLMAAGLSAQDIVAATQLIAFVPYQARLLAGLRAMQEQV